MTGYAFRFTGQDFVAQGSGALYWPARDMLLVADLHLGKSERMARRGGALLPPFETRETLARLKAELALTGATRLALLGDIHDDDAAAEALSPQDRADFTAMLGGRETLLIAGNHDVSGGVEQCEMDGIRLRHIAAPGQGADISGHYHPKARLAGRSRPCFLIGAEHLILPAFGHYTGGLAHDSDVLRALVPSGIAVLTGRRAVPIPLGAGAQRRSGGGAGRRQQAPSTR